MSKHIVEKNYHRLDSVWKSDMCSNCSTACKTSCSRLLAHKVGNEKSYILDNPEKEKVKFERLYDVEIVDVDSIPCDLKTQKLQYSEDGVLIEGSLVTPWKMDWIYDIISDYLSKDEHMSGTKSVNLCNPEELDQRIVCEITSYVHRV